MKEMIGEKKGKRGEMGWRVVNGRRVWGSGMGFGMREGEEESDTGFVARKETWKVLRSGIDI
jgi:hypothetical protein